MKKFLKSVLLTSVCILPCFPSYAMEEDEYSNETRLFRTNIKELSQIALDAEKYAISFMVQPDEDTQPDTTIGHAVLSIVGGLDENPEFWAADFRAPLDNPLDILKGLAWSSPGRLQTTDTIEDRKIIFYRDNKLMKFSSWKYKSFTLSKGEAENIKNKAREQKNNPPRYNYFGANWNPMDSYYKNTCNCSSWVARTIKEWNPSIEITTLLGIPVPSAATKNKRKFGETMSHVFKIIKIAGKEFSSYSRMVKGDHNTNSK